MNYLAARIRVTHEERNLFYVNRRQDGQTLAYCKRLETSEPMLFIGLIVSYTHTDRCLSIVDLRLLRHWLEDDHIMLFLFVGGNINNLTTDMT